MAEESETPEVRPSTYPLLKLRRLASGTITIEVVATADADACAAALRNGIECFAEAQRLYPWDPPPEG